MKAYDIRKVSTGLKSNNVQYNFRQSQPPQSTVAILHVSKMTYNVLNGSLHILYHTILSCTFPQLT